MASKQLNLIYALKDDVIVNIEDVESGLKCGCICPACGESLVAKKGSKMMHHFAHHTGHTCEYGYESSLHLAAKDILSKAKTIMIPAVYVKFPGSYKDDELISESKEIGIDHVELEKRFGDIIPDIVVYAGGKQLFIEIFVTHKVDDNKLKKLKQAAISTIEIDLSKKAETISTDELTEVLLHNIDTKTWLYNVVSQKYFQRFYEISEQKELIHRGLAIHVDYCPVRTRVWRGKPYANFIDDCIYCKYCVTAEENAIMCSGKKRIAVLRDFDIPEEKRVQDSNSELDDMRESAFAARTCPGCGGKIVERESQYGKFWGCSNFPKCKYKAYRDPDTGIIKMEL